MKNTRVSLFNNYLSVRDYRKMYFFFIKFSRVSNSVFPLLGLYLDKSYIRYIYEYLATILFVRGQYGQLHELENFPSMKTIRFLDENEISVVLSQGDHELQVRDIHYNG